MTPSPSSFDCGPSVTIAVVTATTKPVVYSRDQSRSLVQETEECRSLRIRYNKHTLCSCSCLYVLFRLLEFVFFGTLASVSVYCCAYRMCWGTLERRVDTESISSWEAMHLPSNSQISRHQEYHHQKEENV